MMDKPDKAKLSDAELVARLRSGEQGAFDIFVHRYFGMVFSLARARLGGNETAEDLAQEVFLRVFLHLDRLQNPNYLSAWLTRITRNLAMDWQRREEKQNRIAERLALGELPEESMTDERNNARENLEATERGTLVDKALESLAVEQREMILLHYSEGLTKKEIAEAMHLHPSTVGRQMDKAVEALRESVLEEVREVRPRKGARGRAVGALVAAAALSASERTALAESVPVIAAPSATVGWFGTVHAVVAAVLIFIGGTAVYTTTADKDEQSASDAMEKVEQLVAGIHSFRYEIEGETQVNGAPWITSEKGIFREPEDFFFERDIHAVKPRPGDYAGSRIFVSRTETGMLEKKIPSSPAERTEYRSFTPAELDKDLIPLYLDQRPRLNEPFIDFERDSIRLVEETTESYVFEARTKPFAGRRHTIRMTIDKRTGIMQEVSSTNPGNGELATMRVIKVEINPTLKDDDFILH